MVSSSDDWTLVTRSDKKRLARKTKGSKRGSKNVSNSHTSSFVENVDALQSTLEQCINHLQRTDLFKATIQKLQDDIIGSCTTQQQSSDTVNTSSYYFGEIVCYGIGNFSATSLEHYSASLWQLAFAICLRIGLSPILSNIIYCKPNENQIESTIKNEALYIADYLERDNIDPIPLVYYDPLTTNFERQFLMDNVKNCKVLDTNERGRRVAFHELSNSDESKEKAKKGTRMISLYFMPHCPCSLYENVIWSNWDNLVQKQEKLDPTYNVDTVESFKGHADLPCTKVILIGNSIQCLSNPLATCSIPDESANTGRTERRCMQSLLPWMEEISIQPSKSDLTCPGNLVGAFNDTYISSWHFEHSISSTKEDTCAPLPFRPYDTLSDHNTDPELL